MRKYLAASITLLCFSILGCSNSVEVSSLTVVEPAATQEKLKPEGVKVVEEYFRAVEKNQKASADALMSRLSEKATNVNVKEIDFSKLVGVQPAHPPWFTYFQEEGYRLEHAVVLAEQPTKLEVRAFCTITRGGNPIPSVVDFELITQDGRLVIRDLSQNVPESIREAKRKQAS